MAINGRTVGLALSGGGFRSTLFGLGSLWRHNEAGFLGRLDRISSVSGGSILAGLLAHRWQACAGNRVAVSGSRRVLTAIRQTVRRPNFAATGWSYAM